MWFHFGGFRRREWGSFMQPLSQPKRGKMLRVMKEIRDENNGKWNFAKSRREFAQRYPGESTPCTATFSNLAKNYEDYGTLGDPKSEDLERGPDGLWKDAVISEVTRNPKNTIKEVAERLCIPKGAAQNILKEAGWKKGKGFINARTQIVPAKTTTKKSKKVSNGKAPRAVFMTSTPSISPSASPSSSPAQVVDDHQVVATPRIVGNPIVISDDEDMSGGEQII